MAFPIWAFLILSAKWPVWKKNATSPASILAQAADIDQINFAGFVHLPTNPRSYFRKLGTTAVSTEFAHLGFEFDMAKITTSLDLIRQSTIVARDTSYNGDTRAEFELLVDAVNRLDNEAHRVHDLSAPNHQQNAPGNRAKRVVCGGWCIAAIAGIIASISLTVGKRFPIKILRSY